MLTKGQATSTWSQTEISPSTWSEDDANILITSSSRAQNDAWASVFKRLFELYTLEDNWDGEGAEAPDYYIIKSALILLRNYSRTYPTPSRVVPSVDGTIVIEWQLDDYYIEAEIETPYLAEWMQRSPLGVITHWEENIPETEIDSNKYLLSDANKEAA